MNHFLDTMLELGVDTPYPAQLFLTPGLITQLGGVSPGTGASLAPHGIGELVVETCWLHTTYPFVKQEDGVEATMID